MKRNIFAVLVVALTLVLGFAVLAPADTGALADFNAQYPGNSFGNNCRICHTASPPTRNPYGIDLNEAGGTANNIPAATFVAVEGLDSDGDGFTNLAEITAGTYPGNAASHPAAPPKVVVTYPNGGEIVASGSTITILYDAVAAVTSVKVKYSIDNGLTWLNALGAANPVAGFDWNVPTPVKNTNALVKVIGFNALSKKIGADTSNKQFTIQVLSITKPAPGEVVVKGTLAYPVTWVTNGTKSTVSTAEVFYTFGITGIWKVAVGATFDPLTGFDWDVPSPATKKSVKLKVVLKDALGVTVGNAVSKPFIVQ